MMRTIQFLTIIALFAQLTPGSAIAAESIGIEQKVALQVTMQRHIQTSLVDGAYLHLDRKSGKIRKLYPARAHPIILQVGKFFVLCSDFKDTSGKSANIDFYVAGQKNSYAVFQTGVDDRARLNLFQKNLK
jgi:hypothetical protein